MNKIQHKFLKLTLLLALAFVFTSCEKEDLWDVPNDHSVFKHSGGGEDSLDEGDITDDEDDDEDDETRDNSSANK